MTCYKIFEEKVTWKYAQYKCAIISENAKLAVVKSKSVNTFINMLAVHHGNTSNTIWVSHSLWLGGRQAPGSKEPAGGWTWVDPMGIGTLIGDFAYTNWGPTDPDNRSKDSNTHMVTTGADCLVMVEDDAIT